VLAALAALLVAALAATGCVSVPTGGPVVSYPVTQGTAAQNQPYVQIQPQPPGAGWQPADIVRGFLTASASYGSYPQVVREYLSPTEQKTWNPSWSAVVYKSGPNPTAPTYTSAAKNQKTAMVGITGAIQANLLGNGNYSVPSASEPGVSPNEPTFQLTNAGGQWRISSAPQELLLTSNSFANDYQLRNLYFFDPLTRVLVPDPVYVPVRASSGDLMDGLVSELMAPPADWLSHGATRTAFPQKTKVSNVTLNGVTAVVNLTGPAIGKASDGVMAQVSAQLLSTLSGAAPTGSTGQGVQSVEVVVNGKPWTPPGHGNPIQPTSKWNPAFGMSKEYYYITSGGYLTRCETGCTRGQGKPVSLARIGTGYSQIAVSADGAYLAALRGGTLYAGLVGGTLTRRGTGFASVSWDVDDDLWAAQNGQVVMFRGTQNVRQPLAQMVSVAVNPPASAPVTGPFTALQVAPDGVRVALVMDGNELIFGAISRQQTQSPRITLSLVQETVPVGTNFTALTWYGPDDVIALAGDAVTDYPVSGGTPTSIQADPGMQTITASYKQPLIAGLSRGTMATDASLTGSWMPIPGNATPATGISPVYPG
jgi:Lipoprotein LpqB beta-propeller domain/Sporulation and spore germination